MSKSLYAACDQAYEGLMREYPWMGGAVIVREEDGFFSAIPGAYLTDISYTGSRDIVIRWDNKYDIFGSTEPSEIEREDAVSYMEQLTEKAEKAEEEE